MRKLLVVLLALAIGVFLYAENVTVSWTNVSGSFTLTVDENGIDVAGSGSASLSWSPSSISETSGKVTLNLSFTCCSGSAGLVGITFDGNLVKIAYAPSALTGFGTLFANGTTGVGNDYAAFTLKAIDFLTLYYVDLLDAETNTDAGSPAEASYFDDFVGVKLAQDLSVFGLTAYAAFYDADTSPASNNYEYGAEVSLAGKGTLENLSLWIGFGNSAASGVVYGVKASYSYSIEAGIVTLGVNPAVTFSEGLSTMVFSSFTDGKVVSVKTTADVSVDPVSLGLTITPKYDMNASTPLSVAFDATFGVTVSVVSASAEFEVPDLMQFASGWDVSGNVTANVAPVKVAANVLYTSDKDFGYNACVGYTIEEGLKAKVFYGTLYDADGDGVADINTDAQWYFQLSYSF